VQRQQEVPGDLTNALGHQKSRTLSSLVQCLMQNRQSQARPFLNLVCHRIQPRRSCRKIVGDVGRWHRETWQRGTRLNRSQRVERRSAQEKIDVLNDKRIKSCLSRFDSGAYSRLQFLRAVSHSVGAHILQPRVDNNSNSNSSEDEDENSSTNFRGVGIGNGSRGNNLGRLLRSVQLGATCWLRTGAVRT